MVDIWEVLTIIAPVLAPVVSVVLILIGRIIWNHETRLRALEQASTRHGRTMYGDEKDVQQPGLAQDMEQLIERIDRIESKLDIINGYYEDQPVEEDE